MDLIRKLISEKFALLNVDEKKAPHLMGGSAGWQTMTCEQLRQKYNMNSLLWGLRMGKHENGRYIMSLDFDCCGKEDTITKKRLGCQYTKDKLLEYYEIADMQESWEGYDGHYDSSTDGNANVLIDYTDAPEIRKMAEQIGSKFKLCELEVLFGNGHQQVIPPSKTICKVRNEAWRAREFANTEPFYVLTDQSPIYEFVLGLFNEHLAANTKTIKKEKQPVVAQKENTMAPINTFQIDTTPLEPYLDLLFNVIKNQTINGVRIIDWDTYFHIAGILKTNDYNEDVWLMWAMLGGTQKTAEALWKSISKSKKLSIYGLQNIAKRVNEAGYKQWLAKNSKYISLDTLDNENDTARFIADQLISKLVFTKNNRWYSFDARTKLWRVLNNPFAVIITHIQDRISESRAMMNEFQEKETEPEEKKKYEQKIKKYSEHYKNCAHAAFSSQVSRILQDYLFDSEFEQKLDTIPYKIAFRNGIMDLKTGVFRDGLKSSDYLTKTTPYDYEKSTEEHRTKIRSELLKICNMNKDQLEYYLSVLGCALTGDASKIQQFWNLRGQKASNGKSVVFEALSTILPTYVKSINTKVMELSYGSRHKEIAEWRGIRIAWGNEMSKNKQDGEFLKMLTDGTAVEFKVMYGTTDIMPITFKMFFISQWTMNINCDAGVKRRMKMMQFDSKFVDDIVDNPAKREFKKDTCFGELLTTTYKFALMDVIFAYSKLFVDEKYKLKAIPVEWKAETDDAAADNNDLNDFIETYYEILPGVKTLKRDIESMWCYSKSKIEPRNFKDALRALGVEFSYSSTEYIEKVGRGFWTGIKVRRVSGEMPLAAVVAEYP